MEPELKERLTAGIASLKESVRQYIEGDNLNLSDIYGEAYFEGFQALGEELIDSGQFSLEQTLIYFKKIAGTDYYKLDQDNERQNQPSRAVIVEALEYINPLFEPPITHADISDDPILTFVQQAVPAQEVGIPTVPVVEVMTAEQLQKIQACLDKDDVKGFVELIQRESLSLNCLAPSGNDLLMLSYDTESKAVKLAAYLVSHGIDKSPFLKRERDRSDAFHIFNMKVGRVLREDAFEATTANAKRFESILRSVEEPSGTPSLDTLYECLFKDKRNEDYIAPLLDVLYEYSQEELGHKPFEVYWTPDANLYRSYLEAGEGARGQYISQLNKHEKDAIDKDIIYISAGGVGRSRGVEDTSGSLIHEICHVVSNIVYDNMCSPLKEGESGEKEEALKQIRTQLQKAVVYQDIYDSLTGEEPKKSAKDIIEEYVMTNKIPSEMRQVLEDELDVRETENEKIVNKIKLKYPYLEKRRMHEELYHAIRNYNEGMQYAEIIVRVPQILVRYGFDEGKKILDEEAPGLFEFYNKHFLQGCRALVSLLAYKRDLINDYRAFSPILVECGIESALIEEVRSAMVADDFILANQLVLQIASRIENLHHSISSRLTEEGFAELTESMTVLKDKINQEEKSICMPKSHGTEDRKEYLLSKSRFFKVAELQEDDQEHDDSLDTREGNTK